MELYWEELLFNEHLDIRRHKTKYTLYQKGTRNPFVFQACEAKITEMRVINDKEMNIVFQFLREGFLNKMDELVHYCARKMCTRAGRNAIDEMRKIIKSPIDDNALFIHRLIFDKDGINMTVCNEEGTTFDINSVADFQKLFKIGDVFVTFIQMDSITYSDKEYLFDVGLIQINHLPKYNETSFAEDEIDVDDEPKSKIEPKPEPKIEQKPEPKIEPKIEPKPEPKPEPKVEQKPEPKVEPKIDQKPEPKPEPKIEPKIEQKPEPKDEPKPEPKIEQKPKPEVKTNVEKKQEFDLNAFLSRKMTPQEEKEFIRRAKELQRKKKGKTAKK